MLMRSDNFCSVMLLCAVIISFYFLNPNTNQANQFTVRVFTIIQEGQEELHGNVAQFGKRMATFG